MMKEPWQVFLDELAKEAKRGRKPDSSGLTEVNAEVRQMELANGYARVAEVLG
jgi:hypothetical protein